MPIRCVCPLGHPLLVPDELAGGDGQCPVCRQRVAIPAADLIQTGASAVGQVAEIQSVDPTTAPSPQGLAPHDRPLGRGDAVTSVASLFDFSTPDQSVSLRTASVVPPPLAGASRVYESTPEQIRAAYAVSIVTGVLAFLGASPALVELGHPPVAGWVWMLLLLSAIEVAYALWLASLPDWSTLWIGMTLSAGLAAMQAVLLVLVMALPAARSLPLGLEEVRGSLAIWSAGLMTLHGGLACAAGWISKSWRRDYVCWKKSGAR